MFQFSFSKIINTFIVGLVLFFMLDALFVVALKLNYFNYYNIQIFYNILFIDIQNYFIVIFASFLVGIIFIYDPKDKFFLLLYFFSLLAVFSMFFEDIGRKVGESIFMSEELKLKYHSTTFEGHITYSGRENIYIYRSDINKNIKFKTGEIEILQNQ